MNPFIFAENELFVMINTGTEWKFYGMSSHILSPTIARFLNGKLSGVHVVAVNVIDSHGS